MGPRSGRRDRPTDSGRRLDSEPRTITHRRSSLGRSSKLLQNQYRSLDMSEGSGTQLLVKARFNFEQTNEDELSFNKGDVINVTRQEEGGCTDVYVILGNLEEISTFQQMLVQSLEECTKLPESQQRVGGFFMNLMPQMKALYVGYCSNHPSAVNVLTQHSEELGEFMEGKGASSPGILTLTTGLSKPFMRLDKYPTLLKELERHMEESHPDWPDIQKCMTTFKSLSVQCQEVRKRKELELQIVTESIRLWEGDDIRTLGSVLYMSQALVNSPGAELPSHPLTPSRHAEGRAMTVAPAYHTLPHPSSHGAPHSSMMWGPLEPPNTPKPWSLSCLRPAPPLRPSAALSYKEVRKSTAALEEDAQILKVIEAYCTSAKTRQTLNSTWQGTDLMHNHVLGDLDRSCVDSPGRRSSVSRPDVTGSDLSEDSDYDSVWTAHSYRMGSVSRKSCISHQN
ncbi:unnamed protein product [Coregonus sp. 'balchen']|nr:unnamed protein product [Coregonus sp. 'balchen']